MLDDDPGTPPSTQPLLESSASWLPLRHPIAMEPLGRGQGEQPGTQSLLLLMEEKWCGADPEVFAARAIFVIVHVQPRARNAGWGWRGVCVLQAARAWAVSGGNLRAGIVLGALWPGLRECLLRETGSAAIFAKML